MTKALVIFLFALCIPLLAVCERHDSFVIHGSIRDIDTGSVELVYRNMSGEDTTVRTGIRAGKFSLSGRVPEPELVRMNIHTGSAYSISFFIENADIIFTMPKDASDKTVITGSPSDVIYQRLQPQLSEYFENAHTYDQVHQQAINAHNTKAAISADSVWAAQLQAWMHTIRSSVLSQPKNYAGLYFIQWLLFQPPAYDSLLSLYMCLDPTVRNGLSGRAFFKQFQHDRAISPGQPAPEISGSDTAGRPVKLATLRGHYVLLDFWASYCAICRQTNPHLLSVYDKYHPAGFEIVSVSLDFQRAAWIAAIVHDKLTWPQASELRGGAAASAAAYSVQDLPRNWLIDRQGNIIAHDLSIDGLERKLDELLGGGRK